MRKLLTAALLALVCSTAHAGSFYLNDAAGLSGPVACDEQIHEAIWINSGAPMRFTSALTWIGVDYKGVGDVWVFIERVSDGAPMTFVAWDHYANPTSLHQFLETFVPTFDVAQNDGLRFSYYCQSRAKHMQVITKVQHQ